MADNLHGVAYATDPLSLHTEEAPMRDIEAPDPESGQIAQSIRNFDTQQTREHSQQKLRQVCEPQFYALCAAAGVKDARQLLHSLGGFSGGLFRLDDSSDLPLMRIGDSWRPLSEALPISTQLTMQLRSEGAKLAHNDPILRLQDELAELRARIPAAEEKVRLNRGANFAVVEHSRLHRSIRAIENEIKSLEQKRLGALPKFIDPSTQLQIDELDKQIDALKSKRNPHNGRIPDPILVQIRQLNYRRQKLANEL